MAGKVGCGGGLELLFFPTRCPEATGLQEGERDHAHEGVSVKSLPRSSLEVIEAELFLQLLMGLLADPAGFDGAGQLPERCVDGQIAEVVFAFASGAVLADQPYLFAGRMLLAEITDPLRRAVCHPHAHGSKARRQLTVCHLALSSTSWAGREATSGT